MRAASSADATRSGGATPRRLNAGQINRQIDRSIQRNHCSAPRFQITLSCSEGTYVLRTNINWSDEQLWRDALVGYGPARAFMKARRLE